MSAETQDELPVVYALIWRAEGSGPEADEAFQSRIPRLMAWLKELKANSHLVACGGGSFENEGGGLTFITAQSVEAAAELAKGNPMDEIGTTELFLWDVFHADLVTNETWPGPDASQ